MLVCHQGYPEASLRFDSLRSLAPLRQDMHVRHSLGSAAAPPFPQPGI
jgi:hypothetical protein